MGQNFYMKRKKKDCVSFDSHTHSSTWLVGLRNKNSRIRLGFTAQFGFGYRWAITIKAQFGFGFNLKSELKEIKISF